MPYQSPTLNELIEQGEQVIRYRLPEAKRNSVIGVLAKINAALSAGEHQHLEYLAKQIIPSTADEKYLVEFAFSKGVFRKTATHASGVVKFNSNITATIPKGTLLQGSDNVRYKTTHAVEVSKNQETVATVVCEQVGTIGNVHGGTLSLVSPITGVDNKIKIVNISGGADQESLESLLDRLLYRLQYPPAGGAAHDYVRWAKEVPGVTRAWCYPRYYGHGTVAVAVLFNNRADPLPTEQEKQQIHEYIAGHRNPITGMYEGMPANVDLHILAPNIRKLDLTIRVSPDTVAVKTAIKEALKSLINGIEIGGMLYRSQISGAIANEAGEIDHQLISPSENIDLNQNELLVLGEITWQ